MFISFWNRGQAARRQGKGCQAVSLPCKMENRRRAPTKKIVLPCFSLPPCHSSKKGNNRASSARFGLRPYSHTSKASACCTFSAGSFPYQSDNLVRKRCATDLLRFAKFS